MNGGGGTCMLLDALGCPHNQAGLWRPTHWPAERSKGVCLIDLRREPQNNQEVFTAERGGTIWSEQLKPEGVLPSATSGRTEGRSTPARPPRHPPVPAPFQARVPCWGDTAWSGIKMEEDQSRQSRGKKEKIQFKVAEGDGAGNFSMQATTFVETTGKQEKRELLRLEMPSWASPLSSAKLTPQKNEQQGQIPYRVNLNKRRTGSKIARQQRVIACQQDIYSKQINTKAFDFKMT